MKQLKNKSSTRYFSNSQEQTVAKILGGNVVSNSGGGKFDKFDVVVKDSSMGVECKTTMSKKESFSIKKDWLEKNKVEAFQNRLENSSLCFNFEKDGENYFIINETLMQFLCAKLKEDFE